MATSDFFAVLGVPQGCLDQCALKKGEEVVAPSRIDALCGTRPS